ncbi:MAG: prephenate dehydrogenase/arogenate dehydrogenase family protein [Elusimicrobia bacterium]|nr:prephenate dehydrogenase/arogenate dehydrogenase family protein [Elusimicrobiota bacterium]
MVFNRTLFRQVAIIGTGLVGGSIGIAMRKGKLAGKVIGCARHEATLKTAEVIGAIDAGTTSLQKAVYGADLVILAAPVQVIMDQIKEVGRYLRRGTIVTDVGSSKVAVVDLAHKHFPEHVFFVGSHPMAGSEKSGIQHARADLLKGASCLMTPTEKTNRQARDKVRQLWEKLEMTVQSLAPAQHDQIMAQVSHLPHVVAFALMHSIQEDALCYASTGLKDTTRIAASCPRMWTDISLSNSRDLLKAIDEMVRNLSEFRKDLIEKDASALEQFVAKANVRRAKLEGK